MHLYGCYGAILLCALAIVKLSSHGWLRASIIGYVVGLLVFIVLDKLGFRNNADIEQNATMRDVQQTPQSRPASPSMPPPAPRESYISPERQLLQTFSQLQHQVEHLLPQEAKDKFQDIHGLLVVLTQKFRRSGSVDTQAEILKIQRVINNYIAPLIQHYQELPVIFHTRKHGDEASPNDMLIAQLDLIHQEMLKITEHVFFDDLEALAQHGEFLQQKLNPPQFFKVGEMLNKS